MVEIEYDEDKLWDPAERQRYMDELPDMSLFEDHLVEGDVMVDAIQALIEEGETAETLALHWKNKGNELFKDAKRHRPYYQNALQYYSDAFAYALKGLELPEEEKNPEIDMPALTSLILSNRAAVHLELKNYSSCRSDAARSIKYDPKNIKAYFRGAKACVMLRRADDALRYLKAGLELDPESKMLNKLKKEADVLVLQLRAEEELKAKEQKQRRAAVDMYRQLCEQRKVKVGRAVIDDERVKQYEGTATVDQETQQMYWPVLFLYEQYSTTDFVEVFTENDMFIEHLANMFPEEGPYADWDVNKEYVGSRLVIYAPAEVVLPYENAADWHVGLSGAKETNEAEARRLEREQKHDAKTPYWIEISPFCKFHQLLSHPKYVVPGIPMINIFVRDSQSQKDFLRRIEHKVIPLYYEE